MLNYIWAGLVILSFAFAMAADGRDLLRDRYRNGQALAVTLRLPGDYSQTQPTVACEVVIRPDVYRGFYGTTILPSQGLPATLSQRGNLRELRFARGVDLPEPLATMRDFVSPSEKELRGRVEMLVARQGQADAAVVFPPVRFVKLKAITQAAGVCQKICRGGIMVFSAWRCRDRSGHGSACQD